MPHVLQFLSTVDRTSSAYHCPKWIRDFLEFFQTTSDLAGLSIMILGLLGGIFAWSKMEFARAAGGGDPDARWMTMRDIRIGLGSYILLGLEFMIVSDIIHSFLKPDLDSLAALGVIVVIRTAISFFLGRELEAVKHESAAADPTTT